MRDTDFEIIQYDDCSSTVVPKRYSGVPYICGVCDMAFGPEHCTQFNLYKDLAGNVTVPEGKCQLETMDQAMARRAAWLLAKEFDPKLKRTKFR